MLHVSDISQYFYCPRKLYFTSVLGLKLKPRHKMEFGKEEHEKEHRRVSERRTVYGFPKKDVQNIFHNMAVGVP
ncbi:MAG: Dna2/Cas4 domain-containing protein, partial [Methanosarcina sp.]|nr:Dna2/Cas4 domain-containing protein [Methanosarcina sp.]